MTDAPFILCYIDHLSRAEIAGWAMYTNDPKRVVALNAFIAGDDIGTVRCDRRRQDVLSAGFGAERVGFNLLLPSDLSPDLPLNLEFRDEDGTIIPCVYNGCVLTELVLQPDTRVSRVDEVEISPEQPVVLDEITPSGVSGWAINSVNPQIPLTFGAFVDGEAVCTVTAENPREDVKNAGHDVLNVGYNFRLPRRFFDGVSRTLDFRTSEGRRLIIQRGYDSYHNGFVFEGNWAPTIITNIDGLRQGAIKGWALVEDGLTGRLTGSQNILVTLNGDSIAQIKADYHRPDVGRIHECDAYCGFEFKPPAHYQRSHPQPFRFFLIPSYTELTNSPFVTSFVTDQNERSVMALCEEIDSIYSMITRIRRQAQTLLPKPSLTLNNYDEWAQSYQKELSRAVAKNRTTARSQQNPIVSIICPTYKPDLSHFRQAIESVIAQSYENWELIIVDDGSKQKDLTVQIKAFQARDARIKHVEQKENRGISAATNVGIQTSTGDWIAFFDHDDLLVDVAIEVMVGEALRTKAHLLYSDEDKVDDVGRYSDPAFKTDWNYRMLLAVNYICHFVLARRDLVLGCGLLDPKMDGAQDHDFLLRAAEILPAEKIVHVPEVLYHWRKTANSTSTGAGAKRYVVAAGVNAISAHLQRIGRKANVTDIGGTTSYKVEWLCETEPLVRIVVPFKEQVSMTRLCMARVLDQTAYRNYEFVLVDNWSTSPEAAAFCAEAATHPRVTVMRVEEEFNFSRLNNLALANSHVEFFVLMNNDVLVDHPRWLHTLVNEALVDKQVAVVGGKFYYPDRTIQHAGVVLGVGGVAIHAHTGIQITDPGYAGRALVAQEMSAVTAACLLVRAAVYTMTGGLDEAELPVAFNDIDLCLKVREAGYKVIWTPDFTAEHRESVSRGSDDIVAAKEKRFFREIGVMTKRWGQVLRSDPFYSKHFSLDEQPFFNLIDPVAKSRRNPRRRKQSTKLVETAENTKLPKLHLVTAR